MLPLFQKKYCHVRCKYIRALIEEDTVKLHCYLELANTESMVANHTIEIGHVLFGRWNDKLRCRPSAGFCTRLTLQAAIRRPPLETMDLR